jgi:hypothetical protein
LLWELRDYFYLDHHHHHRPNSNELQRKGARDDTLVFVVEKKTQELVRLLQDELGDFDNVVEEEECDFDLLLLPLPPSPYVSVTGVVDVVVDCEGEDEKVACSCWRCYFLLLMMLLLWEGHNGVALDLVPLLLAFVDVVPGALIVAGVGYTAVIAGALKVLGIVRVVDLVEWKWSAPSG